MVTAVQIQGNAPHLHYAKSFRLEYSIDCLVFNQVLDAGGDDKVGSCSKTHRAYIKVFYSEIHFFLPTMHSALPHKHVVLVYIV